VLGTHFLAGLGYCRATHRNGRASVSLRSASGSAGRRTLRLHSDGGPSRAIPATRAAVPHPPLGRGPSLCSRRGWITRSGRVSRPLAIAVGGRRLDRLLPDCRCPGPNVKLSRRSKLYSSLADKFAPNSHSTFLRAR
jgi:hypothetical protein